MDKVVYVGAGTDIIPIIVLPEIKEFIYIDSQPRSEYGMYLYDNADLYRDYFLPELKKILKNNNFIDSKITKNYLEYHNNNNQILKYYINTPFPEKVTDEIKKDIENCENLIFSGFCPDKIIFKLMPNLKNIYCNAHTCYNIPDEDYEDKEQMENSSFRELIKNESLYKYNFQLIKEKKHFEYWIADNIVPDIKNIYEFEKYDSLKKLYQNSRQIFKKFYLK